MSADAGLIKARCLEMGCDKIPIEGEYCMKHTTEGEE